MATDTSHKKWRDRLITWLASLQIYKFASPKLHGWLQFIFAPVGIYLGTPNSFSLVPCTLKPYLLDVCSLYVAAAPLYLLFVSGIHYSARQITAVTISEAVAMENEECKRRIEKEAFLSNLIERITRKQMTYLDKIKDFSETSCKYASLRQKQTFIDVAEAIYEYFKNIYGQHAIIDVVIFCMQDQTTIEEKSYYYPDNAKPCDPISRLSASQSPIIAAAVTKHMVILPDVNQGISVPGYPYGVNYIRGCHDNFQGTLVCYPITVQGDDFVSIICSIRIKNGHVKVDHDLETFLSDVLSRFRIPLEHGWLFTEVLENFIT